MKLIKKFGEMALTTTGSFMFTIEDTVYLFTQIQLGNARFIYGSKIFTIENLPAEMAAATAENTMDLVAIVANGMVYITKLLFFNIRPFLIELRDLPENISTLEVLQEQYNEIAGGKIFKEFIETLPTDGVRFDDDELQILRKAARQELIYQEPDKFRAGNEPSFGTPFTKDDAALILSGLMNLEDEAMRLFIVNRDLYVFEKAAHQIRSRYMSEPDIVKPYERAISNSLACLDPDIKSVNVEFTVNGKTAATRMWPTTVLYFIVGKNFGDYIFINRKAGALLLMKLNATLESCKVKSEGKTLLTPAHISKITHYKKILYKKEA